MTDCSLFYRTRRTAVTALRDSAVPPFEPQRVRVRRVLRFIRSPSQCLRQKLNFNASWICRIALEVDVILPNVEAGFGFDPFPQLNCPPLFNSTWFGALNISVRNSSALRSPMRKYLTTEMSSFPSHGPRRL